MNDPGGEALAAFNLRLAVDSPAPVVVAFSGGGDSLALLLMAHAWAQRAGRPLVALTVDHRIDPASADWAAACAVHAAALGIEHHTLVWRDAKPATGVSAAARLGRHRLLADAARVAGARVILMGHTADDVLEAALMRAEGSNVGAPRAWSPSPVWPQGRGLFLLRPLIGLRRAALRDWLVARGETWIDDPGNGRLTSLRARVRHTLCQSVAAPEFRADAGAADLARDVTEEAAGELRLPIRGAADALRRVLGAGVVSAGGGERLPRAASLDRICERLASGSPFVATLAGARIERDAAGLRVGREPGDWARRPPAGRGLPVGEAVVFDGRFELTARRPGLRVTRPEGRRTHPAVVDAAGHGFSPLLEPGRGCEARSLVLERLRGASGAIACEAAIGHVGETAPGVLNAGMIRTRQVHEPA